MGLSDFDKLVVSVFKIYFEKEASKVIIYKGYEYFGNEKFSNKLENELSKIGSLFLNYGIFKKCLYGYYKQTCTFTKEVYKGK